MGLRKLFVIMKSNPSTFLTGLFRYSTSCHVNPIRLNNKGFTLPELLAVVAIVGILAAFAYPSYRQHVVRTNRSEAQQFMLQVANREEQQMLNSRSYGDLTELNITVPSRIAQYYTITVIPNNGATPPTYTIAATPVSGSTQGSDGMLMLDEKGDKTPPEKWK